MLFTCLITCVFALGLPVQIKLVEEIVKKKKAMNVKDFYDTKEMKKRKIQLGEHQEQLIFGIAKSFFYQTEVDSDFL